MYTTSLPSAPPTPAADNSLNNMQHSGNTLANEMKNIRKAKLARQVYADPSMAGKLVAMEASPTYNAKGEVLQAVSSGLGAA